MESLLFPISETGEGSLMGMLLKIRHREKNLSHLAKDLAKSFWVDDRGQSTTEYILILAVVVMIAVKFKNVFGTRLSSIVDKVGNELDGATNIDGSGN